MKKLSCLLALVCVSAFSSLTVQGGEYGFGLGLGTIYGQGYGYGYNYGSVIRPYWPPYFSIHPPVYYGKRYTRPYGASPFAAWPQLQANSSYAPQPHPNRAQIIANPHLPCPGACTCGHCAANPDSAAGSSTVQSKLVKPLTIDNPYYSPRLRYTSQQSEASQ